MPPKCDAIKWATGLRLMLSTGIAFASLGGNWVGPHLDKCRDNEAAAHSHIH